MLYPELNIVFLFVLVVVLCTYTVVGHDGSSGYLALMGFYAFPVSCRNPIALLLNVVSGVAFLFFRKENFNRRLFFCAVSAEILRLIPAVLLGGSLGGCCGSQRIPALSLRYIFSCVLAITCLKLMIL